MQVVKVGPLVFPLTLKQRHHHPATHHRSSVLGLLLPRIPGLAFGVGGLPVVIRAKHKLAAGVALTHRLGHRHQVAGIKGDSHAHAGGQMQACAGGVALTQQHRFTRLRMRPNQAERALFLQAGRPVAFTQAVFIRLIKQNLQPYHLVAHVQHRHQSCARLATKPHPQRGDLFPLQIRRAATLWQRLPHGSSAPPCPCMPRCLLGRLAFFGGINPRFDDLAVFLAHAAANGL